jgi:hypothetical protein
MASDDGLRSDGLLLAPYVDAARDRIVAMLLDRLRIPSISARPAHAPVELMRAQWRPR